MIGCKVLDLCTTLVERKWSDDDIKEDLEVVRSGLSDYMQKLKYAACYGRSVRYTNDSLVHLMSLLLNCWVGN